MPAASEMSKSCVMRCHSAMPYRPNGRGGPPALVSINFNFAAIASPVSYRDFCVPAVVSQCSSDFTLSNISSATVPSSREALSGDPLGGQSANEKIGHVHSRLLAEGYQDVR